MGSEGNQVCREVLDLWRREFEMTNRFFLRSKYNEM